MRLERYEARTSPTMTALAVLFLVVYGAPVIWTELPSWFTRAATTANLVIWVVFAADLAIRLWLAPRRVRWLVRHPIDVLRVVLPLLRPLRILRVFTAGHSLLTRRGGLLRTGQAGPEEYLRLEMLNCGIVAADMDGGGEDRPGERYAIRYGELSVITWSFDGSGRRTQSVAVIRNEV